MAGVEAERLFGDPDDCGKTDLAEARALVSSFCRSSAEIDVVIDSARSTARRMLKTHLGPLTAITAALITKRTLDRSLIGAIINPPDEDDDGDDGDAPPMRVRMPPKGIEFHPGTPIVR
jgi:hypothetical protein